MKEPFDKKLTQKIRDSFDGHEEPFDPKEWAKFSHAYFGKSRKPFAAWWFWAGGIAASLLLTTLLWNPFTSIKTEGIIEVPLAYNPQEETPSPASDSKNELQVLSSSKLKEEAETFQKPPLVSKELKEIEPLSSTLKKEPDFDLISQEKGVKSRSSAIEVNPSPETSTDATQTLAAAQQIALPSQTLEQPVAAQIENAQQQINSWLAEAKSLEELEDSDDKTKKPLKLGVLMAPQNISNSTQNINFGAGVMSEISFSKRLRLDVGIGYAQQNLIPDQGGSGGSLMSDVASIPSERANSFAGNYISSSSELSFGQIEIPLNMKYSVIQKKSADFYVVSGLSNMFYVNQEKTTTFNTVAFGGNSLNSAPQSLNSSSISESPAGSESQMDVGQLINLGMGFEQNLKNGTSISFEPFYKFTVGDQTFANQRFAIGGINLRMNFQLKK
jgi:hypothetical protein